MQLLSRTAQPRSLAPLCFQVSRTAIAARSLSRAEGFELRLLFSLGCSVHELSVAGFSPEALHQLGVTTTQLRMGGYTASALFAAHFEVSESRRTRRGYGRTRMRAPIPLRAHGSRAPSDRTRLVALLHC